MMNPNRALSVISAIMAIAILSSCSWNLSEKDGDLSDVKVTTTTETAPTVEVTRCFRNDVLSSYTVRYISDEITRVVDREQSYTADGVLTGAWAYHRNENGLVDLAAWYGPDGALRYFYVYEHDADGDVSTQAQYDASSALEWLRRYQKKATGTAAGELETAATFTGPGLALSGGLRYYFIDTASLQSETWNLEVSYGSDSGSLSGGVKAANPKAAAPSLDALETEERLTLTVPALPSLTAPAIPTDFASEGLAVSGYRLSFDDDYGNTTVSLNPSWYPLSGSRTDNRLEKKVSVTLTHDAQNRVTKKTMHYGSTLALEIDIEYVSPSSLFPARVSTSGSSMMLPLDYEISYGATWGEVTGVSVLSNGVLIRRFDYAYTTPVSSAIPAPLIRGMDPFSFMSELLRRDLVISEYDGDGKLVETFTTEAATSSVRVLVNRAKVDGSAGGDLNGYYDVGFDVEGNPTSLVAASVTGAVSWSLNLASFAPRRDDLEATAAAIFDESVEFGPMVESLLAPSDGETVPIIQDRFVYNLLF